MSRPVARSRVQGAGATRARRSAVSVKQGAGNRPVMIGYVRVSTARQAESGLGLAAQEEKLRAAAEANGWDLEIRADRGKSGSRINGGLQAALDDLRARRADGLVVAKLDRLARSTIHAAEIMNQAKREGWRLVILDLGVDLGTPSGRLAADVVAAVAAFEREMISLRTSEAMAAGKARGAQYGRSRMAEPAIVKRIVRAREKGASFGAIARELTEDNTPSPSGKPMWQESTVRRIYNTATEKGAA
jgi:DNA invertase Pin-like site-specific DNA recombinase